MKKLAAVLVLCAVICAALVSCAAATQHTLTAGDHRVTFDVSTPDKITLKTETNEYVSAYYTTFDVYNIFIGKDVIIAISETTDPGFDGTKIDTKWEVRNGLTLPEFNCGDITVEEAIVDGFSTHKGSCYSAAAGKEFYGTAIGIDKSSIGAVCSLGDSTTFNEIIDSLKIEPLN